MRGWTSPEEYDFLRSYIPEYRQHQKSQMTKQFWSVMIERYFKKFPVMPNEAELASVQGDLEAGQKLKSVVDRCGKRISVSLLCYKTSR
jgi:hypothetical protein